MKWGYFFMILYIKAGSVTNAQRAQRILRAKGYKLKIKKIENPSHSDGCGYALEVMTDSDKPLDILRENAVKFSEAEFI